MKTVSVWEKLKLQIDNLELLNKQHKSGTDVSNQVYWQVETIVEILSSIEERVGANKIREMYEEM